MSEKRNDGGPAFPYEGIEERADGALGPRIIKVFYPGMSLRDKFADSAIKLFPLTEENVYELKAGTGDPRHDLVAGFCYDLADAMLEARKGEGGKK